MKFTLSSTVLANNLTALSRVINSKNSLPILNDFVFEVKGNRLSLTASDGENTMHTACDLVDSTSDCLFAIGNHDLLEAVRSLSEQPVTIDLNKDDRLATIIYQNGQFSLPVDDANEFPADQRPADDKSTTINIPSNLLLENINRSLFATAQDELRPVMNGIYFDLTAESLNLVASDGHKLVRNRVFAVHSETPAAFILPKKPATLLKNLLAKNDTNVSVTFDGRNAEIDYEDGVLVCRLIEGRYPNYNSVIPRDNPNSAVIDRVALLAALRRLQPFASETSNLIKFSLENNELKLTAEDFDFSKTATEKITVDYTGRKLDIGFKGSAFIEVLSNFESNEINLLLGDASRAGLVTPSEQPEGQEVVMLLMPMLIGD